jgi:LacI family transcriptional regulator, repressor for deo operon, udp, cdd, tsx, nupC, and nupG
MTPIQEVAKKANVSVATISRVLNNSPYVKNETREKVMDAIRELNYSPNLSGRILRRNETKIVLVLLPTISNPFYSKAVSGIRHAADKLGYMILICNTESDAKKEMEYLNLLKFKQADGAIMMSKESDIEKLEEIGASHPIVQCFEYRKSDKLSYVSVDNELAAYEAVKYLIELGHKRIGLVGCDTKYPSAEQRESGYKKALLEANIELDPDLIIRGDYGFRSGYNCAGKMVEQKPTAIFAISDMQAIGVTKALKGMGIKVPEDISVVGFDNVTFSEIYDPGITTVSQPTYNMGAKAMDILINELKGESKIPQQIIMKHELIIRESARKIG